MSDPKEPQEILELEAGAEDEELLELEAGDEDEAAAETGTSDGEGVEPPVSQPPVSRRSRVAQGLQELFSDDSGALEAEPVPGAATSLHPPAPVEMPDLRSLAEELQTAAGEQSSALAKSRGLLIAAHLYSHVGADEDAFEAARQSSETSPKLGLAALALRKLSESRGDDETVERSLEATGRMASQAISRAHAMRLLVERLNGQGRITEAGQVLDQAARSGDADEALLLQRLVHRLSQGSSLAGVEIPERLNAAVADAQEVLGGSPGTPGEPGGCDELGPLRAARSLKDKDVEQAIADLGGCELPQEALLELQAALVLARNNTPEAASELLKQLARTAPSKRILRRLALHSVQEGDREALLPILDQADPGSGTFSLEERWFLSAFSGQPLQLAPEDMTAVARDNPALAIALGPTDTPAADVGGASSSALLAQVGAGLARFARPNANHPLTPAAQEALSELRSRGAATEIRAALDLLTARGSNNAQLFAESLLELSNDNERASGQLIAGALLQRVGANELAERAYRGALAGSDALSSSATQGLVDVGASDGFELLQASSQRTEDPKLSFVHKLVVALRADEDERLPFVLEAVQDLQSAMKSEGTNPEERPSTEAGLVFAASAAVAQSGDTESAKQTRELLTDDDSAIGELVRFRQRWETRDEKAMAEEGADLSGRALAFWGNASPPAELASPTSEDGERTLFPASELLLHLARGLARDDNEQGAHWGSLCAEVDRAAGAIGIDILKLIGRTEELSPLWLERAKSTDSVDSRRFAYERLAELDEQKGDHSSALLWHRTLAEEFPDHLPALLRLEESLLAQGKPTTAATERLAQALPEGDGATYQLIFGARALSQSDLRAARKHLEPLLDVENPALLALRGLITIGHEKRDDELLLRAYQHIADRPGTDLDECARALSTALILARLDRQDEAVEWTRKAIAAKPDAFAPHQLLFHLHEPEDAFERAEQLEAFGLATATGGRTALFFAAGQAFDQANDPDRAAGCYERALEASPDHKEAFELLCERRESQGTLEAVERLIAARLELIQVGSSEHLELELKLAALLSSQDRPEEAKKHLEEALAAHPGHSGALRSHAEVSAQLGAHESAERSLVALRDELKPGEERTEVMRSLARLYDEHLGQTEKAMDAYQSILEEAPNDERTQSDLVRIYSSLGLAERATAMQTKIIQSASSPEKKRDGALLLADIYENVAGDPKRAGATLERTRKAWPLDAAVLEATVQFMDRQGTGGPRGFLLDRASKDARRKLETGRLDAGLLDTLARVARLTGQHAQSESTEAARNAYVGTSGEPLKGAGLNALDPKIDDLVAPRGLPASLRALMRKTGAAMDAAFSVDLSAMGARRLAAGATFDRMQQIAKLFGTEAPALFVSDNLGAKCLPVTTEPASLLIGADLDELPERERDYLLLRALKLRWLGAGALARSKEEDRWPMLVALLHLFAPNWRPKSVDGRKAAQAKALIEQGLARVGYDDDVPMLALEVIGAIGNQGTSIGDQPRILANRVALLGIGDPSVTLSAMALGEGAKLASGGPSRFRWFESHAEAKDLLLFSTTDKCARAREALGLAEPSAPQPPSGPRPPQSGGGAPAPPSRREAGPPSRAAGPPPAPRRSMAPAPPRRPKPPPPKRG